MIEIPVAIKNLLKSDSVYKNFRVHFPNGERADIINDNIVSESVELEESICSQQTLMFDCCETPTLQFETIGVENIKGAVIECYLEVQCDSSVSGSVQRADLNNIYVYPISYGKFVVNSCKKQADMTHRKIEAYNYSIAFSGLNPLEKAKSNWLMSKNKTRNVIPYHSLVVNDWMYPDNYNVDYSAELTDMRRFLYSQRVTVGGNDYYYIFYVTYVNDRISQGGQYSYYSYYHLWKPRDYRTKYSAARDSLVGILDDCLDQYGVPVSDDDKNTMLKMISLLYSLTGTPASTYLDEADPNGFDIFLDDLCAQYPNYGYMSYISPYLETGQSEIIWLGAPMRFNIQLEKVTGSTTSQTIYANQITILSDYEARSAIDAVDVEAYVKTLVTTTMNRLPIVYNLSISSNVSDLIGDYFELQGKLAKVNREGRVEPVSIENSLSSPVDTLNPENYESLWYDDDMSKPYGRLICTYKDASGNDAFLNRDIVDDFNERDYKKYSITNNSIIKSNQFSPAMINDIFDVMEENINDISYMPLNISISGRPDIEVGDTLTITTRDNETIPCLVMQRSLSGIRRLEDSISAKEEDEDVKTLQLDGSYDSDAEMLTISITKS